MNTWKLLFQRSRQSPHLVIPGALALLNGFWHKVKFRVFGKNVSIGKAFRVYGTFRIMGYGHVTIGDNCFIESRLFKPVAFFTALPEAHIEIRNNVSFSGTTIQCFRHIFIGDWCNIADAYIVDSMAHHLSADRRSLPVSEVHTSPVTLEKNVWISTKVVITHGVTIGENSVIGACSLIRSDVPANSFYAGIPARFIKPVPPSNASASEPRNQRT